MSSHHPSIELLERFAAADLDGPMASVVSAHVEHCSACRRATTGMERTLSAKALDSPPLLPSTESAGSAASAARNEAWQRIASRLGPVSSPDGRPASGIAAPNEIQVDGVKFELPRALRPLASKPLKWMPFGDGGKICKLGDERGKSLFLIYLASNEQVPLHSHAGAEHSYVISGSYSADGMTFRTGDFSASASDAVHAPRAGSEDGCLLLSSVESRLNFLHGWLRPLNGLLWWVLNWRVNRVK